MIFFLKPLHITVCYVPKHTRTRTNIVHTKIHQIENVCKIYQEKERKYNDKLLHGCNLF